MTTIDRSIRSPDRADVEACLPALSPSLDTRGRLGAVKSLGATLSPGCVSIVSVVRQSSYQKQNDGAHRVEGWNGSRRMMLVGYSCGRQPSPSPQHDRPDMVRPIRSSRGMGIEPAGVSIAALGYGARAS